MGCSECFFGFDKNKLIPMASLSCIVDVKTRWNSTHDMVHRATQLYFKLSRADYKTNVLNWWKENQTCFPNLALMTQDYLAIPATSVPCERLFSVAGTVCHRRRTRLDGITLQACVCLKSWFRFFSP
eukprot:TRINITY_DN1798_c0_g2_i4.p2 TRINITY_DN1798_c0_g2~~TRINITY_DN1798_c0_g2_i4.p2  ORF type:complete len:127 (+),score=13.06 TRINITY_DN1798_c0_g2_i4:601-981(+)